MTPEDFKAWVDVFKYAVNEFTPILTAFVAGVILPLLRKKTRQAAMEDTKQLLTKKPKTEE